MLIWDTESRMKLGDRSEDYARYAGCSIAVTRDAGTGEFRFFSDKDVYPYNIIGLAEYLNTAKYTVTYNGLRWDSRLVEHLSGIEVTSPNIDLWHVIRRSLDESWPEGSWSLDRVARSLFHEGKLRQAAGAPALARSGRIAELVSYCMQDVVLTERVWRHMKDKQTVPSPTGDLIDVSEALADAYELAEVSLDV